MDFKERYEIEKEGKGLVLKVNGDSSYILEGGFNRCGDAYYGIHIQYGGAKAGGVISLDEIVRLRDFLNKHISTLLPEPLIHHIP